MTTGTPLFNKKIIAAAVIYFLVSAFFLFNYGFHTDGEAEKIIENANRLIAGREFFNGVFGYFYIAYTLLLALCIKLSINLIVVGVLQIAISFYAALCLYRLLLQGLGNSRIAMLFFIAYLCCYPIQKWNYFLYTESMHTSLLVIGLYLFYKWFTDKRPVRFIVFGIVLILILFTRPVGILFLLSLILVFMVWLYRQEKKTAFYISAASAVTAMVLILNSPLTAFVNPDSIRRMEIICQVPEVSDVTTYKEYNREGLYNAFLVIKNEIGVGNFFITGFKKLGSFFGMWRNYYSLQHNLLLICFTIFYPFVLIGIFNKKEKPFSYISMFAIAYLLFTAMGIFFTCDEWSNRFIGPAFPFILILAAGGVLSLYKRVQKVKS